MTVCAREFPELPDDPDPGEYQCGECGARVTVGQTGTEYGHVRNSSGGDAVECPRRPHAKVDARPDNRGAGA